MLTSLLTLYTYMYIKREKFQETFVKYTLPNLKATFSDFGEYLKVTVPIAVSLWLEWVFYEVQTMIVGTLKNSTQTAGHTTFVQVQYIFFMVP